MHGPPGVRGPQVRNHCSKLNDTLFQFTMAAAKPVVVDLASVVAVNHITYEFFNSAPINCKLNLDYILNWRDKNDSNRFNFSFRRETRTYLRFQILLQLQSGRDVSAIVVTDDYLCYKEPKSPYNFFLNLIINELFKFKTSDEWQYWKTKSSNLDWKEI